MEYGTIPPAAKARWNEAEADRLRQFSDPQLERCDVIVNSGAGEPTECGRVLPCTTHR